MFEGSIVALITPMTPTGSVDWAALDRLVYRQIEHGTLGIVPAGTTGEAPTLSASEHREVIARVVKAARGRVPVIAGCGSYSTAAAIDSHRFAHQVGADAALHVTGYYNRPSQEGIVEHFRRLDEVVDLPIVVYNVPHRTSVDIEPATMARIAELPNVVGVKDATKDLTRPILEHQRIKRPFAFLSGEDGTAVAYNAAGGVGCISVTANVFPAQCAELQQACQAGDFRRAHQLQVALMPMHQALFFEPSPAGAKYACSRLGLCTDVLRGPMLPAGADAREAIDDALRQLASTRS